MKTLFILLVTLLVSACGGSLPPRPPMIEGDPSVQVVVGKLLAYRPVNGSKAGTNALAQVAGLNSSLLGQTSAFGLLAVGVLGSTNSDLEIIVQPEAGEPVRYALHKDLLASFKAELGDQVKILKQVTVGHTEYRFINLSHAKSP